MAERVVVHVGLPKSGTTFLQNVLWNDRELLAGHGVLFPGEAIFDHNRAAMTVRGAGGRGKVETSPRAAWRRMRRQVAEWSGVAVFSNEWFTLASAEQAAWAVERLGPAEVHVVATVRDLPSLVTAGWQETLKTGHGHDLDGFVDRLDSDDDRWCWRHLDPAEVLARWSTSLPPEQVHVVTMPPRSAGPDELWARFARACGIPATVAPDLAGAAANESLGVQAAVALQRLGPRLAAVVETDAESWRELYTWLRLWVGHALLVPVPGDRIALRPEQWQVLRDRSAAVAERLAGAGYQVHGDLAALAPTAQPAGRHPDTVGAAELVAVEELLVEAMFARLRTARTGPEVPGSPDGLVARSHAEDQHDATDDATDEDDR